MRATHQAIGFRNHVWLGLIICLVWMGPARAAGRARDPRPQPLRISVYATADDVVRYLGADKERNQTVDRLRRLDVSRVFLEGRRGDEYVAPRQLSEIRSFVESRGISSAGGIATVPGGGFGVRQAGELGWLNWEDPKTRGDVAGFFTENAPVFDELIVDDFYCTGDVSPASDKARGARDWGHYRRDLMVSSIDPLVIQPSRRAKPSTRLVMKFPQWYDRFHMFGYDPARMAPHFSAIWVGTEVREPATRRMGFVQPTEGFINFSWIRSVAGAKVRGAWFDHIECSAENFTDQAFQSVLAGARELTLFRLGDLMDGHPGDALLERRLPELREVAALVQKSGRAGISFYKPCCSDPGANLYLADYLAALGWPVIPVAAYPARSKAVVLAAQAAADPRVVASMDRSLRAGATVVVTTEFLRRVDARVQGLAGVRVDVQERPGTLTALTGEAGPTLLTRPLDVDRALRGAGARILMAGRIDDEEVPVLTESPCGRGRLLVLNVRTFSEQDFRSVGEVLLAPRLLGLSELPQPVADALRRECLGPALPLIKAPAGVSVCLFRGTVAAHNFRSVPVTLEIGNRAIRLQPHQCALEPLQRRF